MVGVEAGSNSHAERWALDLGPWNITVIPVEDKKPEHGAFVPEKCASDAVFTVRQRDYIHCFLPELLQKAAKTARIPK